MEVRSKYESPLVLEELEIMESAFRKEGTLADDVELGVHVKHNLKKQSDGVFEILLETTVSDADEKLYVYVKGRAIFATQQENRDILEKNTIAIMFPYIRSYISLITTQPGMNPIVLPAMNIIAMLNDQRE